MSNIDTTRVITAAQRRINELNRARRTTVLSRFDFCTALADLDILDDAECVATAKGDWPRGFRDFLDHLSPEEARNAQTLWAATVKIHRTDPTILALAWWFDINDATLDAMFGVRMAT